MRSNLGRARGLGSAKTGLHHWWMQRITAVALLPLSLYFVLTVLMLDHSTREQVALFMAEPWNADAVADPHPSYIAAQSVDPPDDFMARDNRNNRIW